MKVRIYCECSGVMREAFRARGHDAVSVDVQPAVDGSAHHVQGDALDVMRSETGVELAICHPPCTRLANSGALRLYRGGKKANGIDPVKWAEMEYGAAFFREFFDVAERAGIPRLCVENPIQHGHALRTHGCGRPDQIIQPYQFGDDASKATALWLRGLPWLRVFDLEQWARPREGMPAIGGAVFKPDRQRAKQAHAERGTWTDTGDHVRRDSVGDGEAMGDEFETFYR